MDIGSLVVLDSVKICCSFLIIDDSGQFSLNSVRGSYKNSWWSIKSSGAGTWVESPGNKTLLIGERMLLLLEYPSEKNLASHFLLIVITDFGVLIIIWFYMINGIPAKISQLSFRTTKAVKFNGGISSQFKYIFISPVTGKYDCSSAWTARWVAGNIDMPADLQIDYVIWEAAAPVSNLTFNCLFL